MSNNYIALSIADANNPDRVVRAVRELQTKTNFPALTVTLKTPASSTSTGAAGDIEWDTSFIYVCTATNNWKRATLSTF